MKTGQWILMGANYIAPIFLLILGPYFGLVPPNHHMRMWQLGTGILLLFLITGFNYFGVYRVAKNREELFRLIRERAQYTVRDGSVVWTDQDGVIVEFRNKYPK